MNGKKKSKLYALLSAASMEGDKHDFETLSLRISKRNSAMIQALTTAFQRPALTLLTDSISQNIAEALIVSADNESLILDEIKEGVQHGSALSILFDYGAITYDYDAGGK
ncbi:hypothetical protein [Pseudomonas sediminis]|uniref:hypothetical protein n=1 Tax=Pseudomonas sediminis TaxID=1691904 RepID=UPI0031CC68DA